MPQGKKKKEGKKSKREERLRYRDIRKERVSEKREEQVWE